MVPMVQVWHRMTIEQNSSVCSENLSASIDATVAALLHIIFDENIRVLSVESLQIESN